MDKREIVAIGKRIKERKGSDLGDIRQKEYDQVLEEIDKTYTQACLPLALQINKAIAQARKELGKKYGNGRISSSYFPCQINLKDAHAFIAHYSKREQARLDNIQKVGRDRQTKLNAAFDDFEMAVLMDGADGALKVFIEAVKKI